LIDWLVSWLGFLQYFDYVNSGYILPVLV